MHSHVHEYWELAGTFFAGGGAARALRYVGKRLPPLPANAGWWSHLFYNLIDFPRVQP